MKKKLFYPLLFLFCVGFTAAQEAANPAKKEIGISLEEFRILPHLPPVQQDSTLVCWSFATTSFIESEVMRIHNKKIRLSVFYSVYYRLFEKCESLLTASTAHSFSAGDLFMGVFDVVERYGIVPASAYEGEKTTSYNHITLYRKLDSLLQATQELPLSEREKKREDIRLLLNTFLGTPPKQFKFEGKIYTPQSFRDSVVNLPWWEYIILTSFRYAPYYTWIELKVPDNWKHAQLFFNIPLDLFLQSLSEALQEGVTAVIDADITEPTYERTEPWCRLAANDRIPSEEREHMFESGETTDDHLMHIVGYGVSDGEEWFLAKDSWRTAWQGNTRGYKFLHSSYVTYKILAVLTHRNALSSLRQFLPAK